MELDKISSSLGLTAFGILRSLPDAKTGAFKNLFSSS